MRDAPRLVCTSARAAPSTGDVVRDSERAVPDSERDVGPSDACVLSSDPSSFASKSWIEDNVVTVSSAAFGIRACPSAILSSVSFSSSSTSGSVATFP